MGKNGFLVFICILFLFFLALPVSAGFPFSFRKQTLKTDYSQTVWDQLMQEQAVGDMRRGMLQMSQSRYHEAANSFAKAILKNSKDPMAYLLLGASLYWSGKVDNAISEYNEALRLDPKNPLAYQLLGIAFGWKGEIAQAQDLFSRANTLDPNKADTHMNLGSTYAVQNKLEKALEHFRRSAELAPREPLYHYQLGTVYEALGRDQQAEESFKKALHYFSGYEDAQLSLAALYESMERNEEALKFYKKAVKTKPGDYVARLRYAFLLLRQGNELKAREVIEEAFSISRFKSDNLALNIAYRLNHASGESFEQQIQTFLDKLAQVSAAKTIEVEALLEFQPREQEPEPDASSNNRFERAYKRFRDTQASGMQEAQQTVKRMFTFAAADAQSRRQQIQEFGEGLRKTVEQLRPNYQVNLSMKGRTLDYNSPYALNENRASAPKAVYDPRIVGNDMGLWVMGRSWLKFVDEATENLQEYQPKCPAGNTCDLLAGLAGLARGNEETAKSFFERAVAKNPADALGFLGLGTAQVIAGNDEQARIYYQRALELSPANKTAKRNLDVLGEE